MKRLSAVPEGELKEGHSAGFSLASAGMPSLELGLFTKL
jgi:hypothetical protein